MLSSGIIPSWACDLPNQTFLPDLRSKSQPPTEPTAGTDSQATRTDSGPANTDRKACVAGQGGSGPRFYHKQPNRLRGAHRESPGADAAPVECTAGGTG